MYLWYAAACVPFKTRIIFYTPILVLVQTIMDKDVLVVLKLLIWLYYLVDFPSVSCSTGRKRTSGF